MKVINIFMPAELVIMLLNQNINKLYDKNLHNVLHNCKILQAFFMLSYEENIH